MLSFPTFLCLSYHTQYASLWQRNSVSPDLSTQRWVGSCLYLIFPGGAYHEPFSCEAIREMRKCLCTISRQEKYLLDDGSEKQYGYCCGWQLTKIVIWVNPMYIAWMHSTSFLATTFQFHIRHAIVVIGVLSIFCYRAKLVFPSL